MAKKKRTIPPRDPAAVRRHEETQRLLADRIAYHRRKLEEERAAREKAGQ